jgi:CRP-like cAMP-binding protein
MRDRQLKDRMRALRALPLVAGCTDRELVHVDRLGAAIGVRPGTTLTREGQWGRDCFVVIDGVAEARRDADRIGVIGAGSVAGEIALLDRTSRTATVVACTPMQLLVLTDREFDELLGVNPCIEAGVRRIAAERRAALAG